MKIGNPKTGALITFCALIFLGANEFACAEYRAFQLRIVGASSTQTVVSTLDPNQYADFHLAGQWDNVLLEKTWMCYGRTNGLPTCSPPDEGEVPSQAPPPLE